MFPRLALILSIASLAAAQSTILGCLPGKEAKSSGLLHGEGKTVDECSTSCLNDNTWFSTFEASTSTCLCSPTIPNGMTRTSEGCSGAGYIVSVIRPSLLTPNIHAPIKPQSRRTKPVRKGEQGLCAAGLTACNVEGSGDYTCVDVSSDSTSCGGCKFGAYGIVSSSPGPDCATMPGAHRDSVECVAGECFAWACQQGYRLIADGTCTWI